MCCNKRKERRSQAAAAAAIVGATYQQYQQHNKLRDLAMGIQSRNYPAMPTPTLLDPKTSPTHQAPSTHTANNNIATPPSYESVMNSTSLPNEEAVELSTRTAKPIVPNHINDTESFPLHDATGVPAGMTWWQAYKARKTERREAWRAEKAEWRAEKAEWKALRRAGRC